MLQLRQGVLAWSGALRGFDYGSDDKQVEWEDSVGFLSVRRKEVRWWVRIWVFDHAGHWVSFAQVRILIVKITGCFLLYCSLKKSCCGEIYGRWETVVVVFVQVFYFYFFFFCLLRGRMKGERWGRALLGSPFVACADSCFCRDEFAGEMRIKSQDSYRNVVIQVLRSYGVNVQGAVLILYFSL